MSHEQAHSQHIQASQKCRYRDFEKLITLVTKEMFTDRMYDNQS